MSYNRYDQVVMSVKDFEDKVEDLVRKFKKLKMEWLPKAYDKTSIDTLMQTVKKEVLRLRIDEYDRLNKMIDEYRTGIPIPYPEDDNKSEELRSRLKVSDSKLDKKYGDFKKEVKLIWGWEAKQ